MSRTVSLNLLDRVRIASPCPARWEDMAGDDKVRHCAQCDLDVHNFSAMTREEAEGVLQRHLGAGGEQGSGRVCAGWYRRADGTAIFQDCPRGLAALRAKARRFVAGVAALCGVSALISVVAAQAQDTVTDGGWTNTSAAGMAPLVRLRDWLRPAPPRVFLGGVVSCPPPPPPPAPGGASESASEGG